MARPLRIEYEDALHHVISRGDNRRRIVWDDADRMKRLAWLERVVGEFGWVLHSFCLMTNHEHLFVQTPHANLGPGMKLLNAAYTQYINKRHRRCGHLFQGRYKAHLVEQDGYFAALSRYIHLNPVRARMVDDPANYAWSSFPGYVRKSKQPAWVTSRTVLAGHGPGPDAARRRRYARYVRAGVDDPPEAPWSKVLKSGVIGSQVFVDEVKERLAILKDQPGQPAATPWIDRPGLDEVISAAADKLDADASSWVAGRRLVTADRALVAFVAMKAYGYRGKELSDALGYRSQSSVPAAIRRVESSTSLRRAAGRLRRAVAERIGGGD